MDFIYAQIAIITGWTYPTIDDVTLWDVADLQKAWLSMHGHKQDKKPKTREQAEELQSLIGGLGGAVTRGKNKKG